MKQLNGYRASHRNKWYFLQHGILNVQELALLEFYADLFDFQPSSSNYGTFKVNFEDVRKVFNYKSDSSVRNWHKKLLDLGFIESTINPHIFKLVCCGRYIGTSEKIKGEADKYQASEKNQPIDRILQSFGIDFQSFGTKIQPVGNDDDKNIDSSTQTVPVANKDSYKEIDTSISASPVSQKVVVIKQTPRTDAEYQKIYEDGGFKKLTPDDMRWIDENTTEKILIESDEHEQEIVSLYFHGDPNEFQKNLLTS